MKKTFLICLVFLFSLSVFAQKKDSLIVKDVTANVFISTINNSDSSSVGSYTTGIIGSGLKYKAVYVNGDLFFWNNDPATAKGKDFVSVDAMLLFSIGLEKNGWFIEGGHNPFIREWYGKTVSPASFNDFGFNQGSIVGSYGLFLFPEFYGSFGKRWKNTSVLIDVRESAAGIKLKQSLRTNNIGVFSISGNGFILYDTEEFYASSSIAHEIDISDVKSGFLAEASFNPTGHIGVYLQEIISIKKIDISIEKFFSYSEEVPVPITGKRYPMNEYLNASLGYNFSEKLKFGYEHINSEAGNFMTFFMNLNL